MSIDYASQQKFGVLVGKETTPGTEATTITTKLGAIQSVTPRDVKDNIGIRAAGGGRNIYFNEAGAEHYGVDVSLALQTGQLFYYALGSHNVSGTGPYTHTLTLDTPLPSLTVEVINSELNWSRKYLGSKINEIKIAAVAGEEVKIDIDFMSMGRTRDNSPGSPAVDSTRPFIFSDSTLTLNSVDYSDALQSFELSIKHNLEEVLTHNSSTPRALAEGALEIEATAELKIVDTAIDDLFQNSTEFALEWKLIRTASSDEITISAQKCKIFAPDMPFDIEGKYVTATVPILIAQEDLTITVIDSIADYTT